MWQMRNRVTVEALGLLQGKCIKGARRQSDGRVTTLTVECTLPLDVETAVGLQILGDRAVADPDLELTILASLEGE